MPSIKYLFTLSNLFIYRQSTQTLGQHYIISEEYMRIAASIFRMTKLLGFSLLDLALCQY